MRLRALSQYEGHADADVLCREEEDGSLDLVAGRSEDDYVVVYLTRAIQWNDLATRLALPTPAIWERSPTKRGSPLGWQSYREKCDHRRWEHAEISG